MEYALRTILFATDTGPYAPDVFNHAAGIAQQFGAKIHIVYALEPVSEYAHAMIDSYIDPGTTETLRQEGFEEARQAMRRRLEAFCEDKLHAGTKHLIADMRVIEGMPYWVILDEAKRIRADLIVLGSHGMSALGELFLGSVAHKVIMHSSVPVLLVPLGKHSQAA